MKIDRLLGHDGMWAGTEASLNHLQKALANLTAQDLKVFSSGEEDFAGSDLLSVHGNVGVVSVRGGLVPNDSPLNKFFGLTSYEAISNALVEAAEMPAVHSILLDVDSPGGSVNGVSDVSELVRYVDGIKPVYAYTSGTMASGAYWIASGARQIYASKVANVGSIGVITTSMEYTGALEKEGVKATVIRAGEYKQMGNPYEPLTETGKQEIQAMVDSVYKIFVSDVASGRQKSYDYTDKYMAQGRVMLAEDAKTVGLIDSVMTFEQALLFISKQTLDKSKFSFENKDLGATMNKNKKKTLVEAVMNTLTADNNPVQLEVSQDADEALREAIAEKVINEAVKKVEAQEQVEEADEQLESEALTDSAQDFHVLEDGTVIENAIIKNPVEASLTETIIEAVNENTSVDVSAVSLLKEQLAAKDEQLLEAKFAHKEMLASMEAFAALEPQISAIVQKAVVGMQIALGQPKSDFTGMSIKDILSTHASVSATFAKNFTAGRQSVSTVVINEAKAKDLSFEEITALARANATSL